MICSNCQKELPDGVKFCSGCGNPVVAAAPAEPVVQEEPVVYEAPAAPEAPKTPAPKAPKKPINKKVLKLAGIGLAAVVIIVLAIVLISSLAGGGSKGDDLKFDPLYLKDGQIYFADYAKNTNFELTSDLADDFEDYQLAGSAYVFGSVISMNEKGNRIFFPDKISYDDEGLNLFYKDLNKKDAEAVKIDSDIVAYAINAAGTEMIYVKGEDGNLYYSDLEEKEKISSDVEDFYLTDDLSKVAYLKEDNIYLWEKGGDSEKIISGATTIHYCAEDLSMFVYSNDDVLYKYVVKDDEKVKIASDVNDWAVPVYESGEMFYVKEEVEEVTLASFIIDDMADADAAKIEEYWNDWDMPYEEVESAYERDYIREYMNEDTWEVYTYELYYYNGEESILVTDKLSSGITTSYEIPLRAIYVSEDTADFKIKMSEINYSYELYEKLEEALYSEGTPYLVYQDKMVAFEEEEIATVRFNTDADTIYYRTDVSDEGEGDLYKASVKNGEMSDKELVDSDVSSRVYIINDNDLIYFKDLDTEKYTGDLYLNGAEVDYDVYYYSYTATDNGLLYFADWDEEDSCGTLKLYAKGESTTIGDEVYDYTTTANGDILYLNDFSDKHYTGTLYLYSKGESEKIDDDVLGLVPVSTAKIHYLY